MILKKNWDFVLWKKWYFWQNPNAYKWSAVKIIQGFWLFKTEVL